MVETRQVAVGGEGQRARDRGGGHVEEVRPRPGPGRPLGEAPGAARRRSGAARPPPPGPGGELDAPPTSSACVPTASGRGAGAQRHARAAPARRRGDLPGEQHRRQAGGGQQRSSVRRCCSASVSVGTSSAAWAPASTAWQIARAATSVLPEPTSPWSRRRIGRVRARSRAISPRDPPLLGGERERQRGEQRARCARRSRASDGAPPLAPPPRGARPPARAGAPAAPRAPGAGGPRAPRPARAGEVDRHQRVRRARAGASRAADPLGQALRRGRGPWAAPGRPARAGAAGGMARWPGRPARAPWCAGPREPGAADHLVRLDHELAGRPSPPTRPRSSSSSPGERIRAR